jgi:hypothetical protein
MFLESKRSPPLAVRAPSTMAIAISLFKAKENQVLRVLRRNEYFKESWVTFLVT